MQISFCSEAQTDASAAVDWYISEGAIIAAADFTDELDQALVISQFPELGDKGVHNTRSLLLHSFPYSLIYRLQDNLIPIIASAHHSRRLIYWIDRR